MWMFTHSFRPRKRYRDVHECMGEGARTGLSLCWNRHLASIRHSPFSQCRHSPTRFGSGGSMVLASSHGASVIKLAACPAEPGSSAGQATLFGVSPGQLPAEHDGWRSRSACSRTSQKTGAESCACMAVDRARALAAQSRKAADSFLAPRFLDRLLLDRRLLCGHDYVQTKNAWAGYSWTGDELSFFVHHHSRMV
jgi:hypothetical protein